MNPNSELDPQLASQLKTLRRAIPRDPQLASRARESFLAEAAQIAPRVSISPRNRLDGWKETFTSFWKITRREKNPMFNITMAVLIVLGVIFGGGATTVAAAQTALPEQALYPIKIWSEDIRLGWEIDPQAKLDLELQFTARRAEEIGAMLVAGGPVSEPVLTRFENQQRQTLEYAAGMSDELVLPALEQVRNQARQQEQLMMQLQVAEPVAAQIRARIQIMMQAQAQTAQQGIDDPLWLREQLRLHERIHLATPTTTEPSLPTATSATGNNPWTTGTPTPLSGYGPGESQNPWTEGTPTPGSGYGPGTGTGNNPNPSPGSNSEVPEKLPSVQPGNGGGGQPGNGNGNRP